MLLRSFQLRVASRSSWSSTYTRKRMMHTDQVPLTLATAQSMIRDQFPRYRDHEITALETSTGTVNAIFRIGLDATARFPLQVYHPANLADVLRGEAAAMTELAEHCPFPTPKPLGLGQATAHYPLPWAVQSWIEGSIATPEKQLASSHVVALDLVQLIASLRAAPTHGRQFDGHNRGGHLPDHDKWLETCFGKSEGLLDVPRLRRVWAELRQLPPTGPDVMSHKDLTPANLLVHGEHIVGVLDGGGFGPADPALDLVAVWHMLDRERRELVRVQLRSGEVEWKRGAAWAFEQAMDLIWYYESSNPSMSELGRSTLQRILDDRDLLVADTT